MADEREVIDVLMVEDDKDDYFITRRLLDKARGIDCRLSQAVSYEDGLEELIANSHDVCLVDYRLGAHDGLELLHEASAQNVATPIILVTGQGDLEIDLGAMAAGAADYLVKDEMSTAVLERSIRYALERRRAQQRIRRQAALLDEAHDAISTHDLEGHIQYWNRSAERLTGYAADEIEGRTMHCLLQDDEHTSQEGVLREALDSVLKTGEWTGELRLCGKDDSEVIMESRWSLVRDDAGQPDSILVINNDVTERKKLETQFMRSQRMDSIGRLVGGIAHDLGNLLMPIGLGVKTLRARLQDNEDTMRTLSMIQKSAERGSEMVRRVLAFARGVEGEHVRMGIQPVLEEIEAMASETFPEHIEVRLEVEDDCCDILADVTQLQQVLMNLCVNARDAMDGEGTLTVRAASCRLDDERANRILEAEAGDYMKLTITDTGPGIPPEMQDKIFEPFFTTKASGEGTGLGLSTVYSIVKSHDGFIEVHSKPGEGASFDVYLPQADEQEVVRAAPGELPALQAGNGERVLVMDDEDHVRHSLAEVLREAGYQPVTAETGAEALRQMENHDGAIAAVIADLMMPERDGHETIRTFVAEHPDCPVLVSSGVSENQPDRALKAGADEFLAKPYSAEKLCRTLQNLLGNENDQREVVSNQQQAEVQLTNAE